MDLSITAQIAALRRMTVAELQGEWFHLYGEPTRSRNRVYLWKRLAWRIQELHHGGLSDDARKRIDDLGVEGFTRARTPFQAVAVPAPRPTPRSRRDPRLPAPGTVITKTYKGRELRVVVREDGFEFEEAMHDSLTALAKKITDCRSINGPLFWGLSQRKRKRS